MSRKRKRHATSNASDPAAKRPRPASLDARPGLNRLIANSMLPLYYPRVTTLREYLLSRLPASSRSRRRRILACCASSRDDAVPAPESAQGSASTRRQGKVAELLDTIVVGYHDVKIANEDEEALVHDWEQFSQKARSTGMSGVGDMSITLSDVRLRSAPWK